MAGAACCCTVLLKPMVAGTDSWVMFLYCAEMSAGRSNVSGIVVASVYGLKSFVLVASDAGSHVPVHEGAPPVPPAP